MPRHACIWVRCRQTPQGSQTQPPGGALRPPPPRGVHEECARASADARAPGTTWTETKTLGTTTRSPKSASRSGPQPRRVCAPAVRGSTVTCVRPTDEKKREGRFTCGCGSPPATPGGAAAAAAEARAPVLPCDTDSHSLVPVLVPPSSMLVPSEVCSRRRRCCCCSSYALRSSHRARSASARARMVALCRRHSTTCDSYSAFQASNSAGETEDSGDVAAGGRAGSDGSGDVTSAETSGVAAAAAVFAGWKGETRGRLGTENGSERAA
jgi:hypothetical protein